MAVPVAPVVPVVPVVPAAPALATVVPLELVVLPEGMGPPQTPRPNKRAIMVMRQQSRKRPAMHPVLQQSLELVVSTLTSLL